MKSLILAATVSLSALSTSYACDELETTQAVVDYVCNYSLVSNTQCRIWREDMRQMNYNNRVIIDSFIGWDEEVEDSSKYIAEN